MDGHMLNKCVESPKNENQNTPNFEAKIAGATYQNRLREKEIYNTLLEYSENNEYQSQEHVTSKPNIHHNDPN